MRNKIFIGFLIFQFSILSIHSSSAQTNSSSIKTAAFEMGKALVEKNSDGFLRFVHPSMITMAGGKEQLQVLTDSALKVFEQFGGKISKINYGNPSEVIEYKKTMQAVLPQSTYLSSPFGDVELASSLIAISSDKGKSWTFIDTNLFGIGQIKKALPELSPELNIPKSAAPKIIMK